MLLPHHSLLTYNSKKEAWKRKKPKLLLNALVMPRHVFAPGLRPKVRGMSSSWNCPKTLNWMSILQQHNTADVSLSWLGDFTSPTLFLNVDKPMVMECGWRDSSRIILTMRRVGELHHPFIFCVVVVVFFWLIIIGCWKTRVFTPPHPV